MNIAFKRMFLVLFLFIATPLVITFNFGITQDNQETIEANIEVKDSETQESLAEGIEEASTESVNPELVSVNFENTDIAEVVRILAEKSGINIVVGPDVKATVNLQLNNVHWEKALDVILRTYNLTYKKEESLIRIMTLDQLKLEEEKVPLSTKIVTLNFAKADEVKTTFNSMLSPRGKIDTNTRTNSLIITDLPENITKIEEVARALDTKTPQVMIEVMMADVKLTEDEQLGINWQITYPQSPKTEYTVSQSIPLPSNIAGALQFGTTFLEEFDFSETLRIWQEQKRVNVLAHPQILTLDNQLAHIELTEQIPYTSQSQSTEGAGTVVQSTQFKESGIKLDVTPHITTKDNYISMNLKAEQSFRTGFTSDNQPIIDARKAETNLLVKDGQTIVIGGLRKKEDSFTVDKIPFLGDIPLFGALFRKRVKGVTDIDLLIFVTPRIVDVPRLTDKETERLKLFEEQPSADLMRRFDELEGKWKKKTKVKEPAIEKIGPKEETFGLRPPS